MRRGHFPRGFVSTLLAGVFAGAVCLVNAQVAAPPAASTGAPGGLRYLEAGQPPVMIHPTVDAARAARARRPKSSATQNVFFHGGGEAVETAPKVFLVLWGSQWNGNDPSNEESLLVAFFKGVGGSPWLNTVTQYCEGVPSGTFFCDGAGTPAGNPAGLFVAAWYDNAGAAPQHPNQSQLAGEAVRAAAFFGNTTSASNASVQYVIATAHGDNPSGFPRSYCAWHSSTKSGKVDIAYTNLPYITDAGAACGANFNGLGANAGITIVAGHEMAESITDQFPNGGWLDSSGEEIADKCVWISSGQGAAAQAALSTGPFPVQSLWSNAFNSDAGGCVLSF